ncbi:unnamed protein product [Camellia sinensis]
MHNIFTLAKDPFCLYGINNRHRSLPGTTVTPSPATVGFTLPVSEAFLLFFLHLSGDSATIGDASDAGTPSSSFLPKMGKIGLISLAKVGNSKSSVSWFLLLSCSSRSLFWFRSESTSRSRDGRINYDEFVAMMRKGNPEMVPNKRRR